MPARRPGQALVGLLLALTAFTVVAAQAEPLSATLPQDLRRSITRYEDRVLILSSAGLYRFQPESEAWTVTTREDGLPDPPFTGLTLADDQVWACGGGVCFSDARLDDWQRYATGIDIPGQQVFDVEVDEDYAYAATDQGAARFDLYILEWETVSGGDDEPLGVVHDVAVGEERVWFAMVGGVAEYRKETESMRIDRTLGQLDQPAVLALRQSTRYLWAICREGIARYDKDIQSWTSFGVGHDLPDSRIHQVALQGDDLWLGTDAGLWRFRADAGIWRRDESGDQMPGSQVRAFALSSQRIWVVTERAFALYEQDAARWLDFTANVPCDPADLIEMAWIDDVLLLRTPREIVYGLSQGQSNPSLFTYRSFPIRELSVDEAAGSASLRFGLDDSGFGLRTPDGQSLYLKGGATIYVEEDESGSSDSEFGDLISETRLDLILSGRLGEDRTLGGFYDTTDPDNTAYQLTYRGSRTDNLRSISLGEIESERFNSVLSPGTGLRGGEARLEVGPRSEETHRRLLTADAWVGEQRTVPGRDVFIGGNRAIDGSVDDIDYADRQIFPRPEGWTFADFQGAVVYRDDLDPASDDANSVDREIAGRSGTWDRLHPNDDYLLGPDGTTLILTVPLGVDHFLAVMRAGGAGSTPGDEVDLTDRRLRNHYWITIDPIPGSLELAIVDSSGTTTDGTGRPYLELFSLDADADGFVDPDRFSPISGFLSFPDSLPFPASVYEEDPSSQFAIAFTYRAERNTFRLSRDDLVPDSERITVDRERLRPDVDYSMIPSSGLFVFFEHVLLDEDSVIEVEYEYEIDETKDGSASGDEIVVAGQLGLAPHDHLFLGASATRWRDGLARDVTNVDLNARLEWKESDRFLRVTPELALSLRDDDEDRGGASGITLGGRLQNLEVSGLYRNLGADYASFENRRTLLGRLREETEANARYDWTRNIQTEVEWTRALSDSVSGIEEGADGAGLSPGRGTESSIIASLRLLRSGLPNLEIQRGRVLVDATGERQEKWISRAELELSTDQVDFELLGVRRLWLRAFLQRSERDFSGAESEKTTDHAFVRLNGSAGTPLSWNVAFEDRRTYLSEEERSRNLRRFQELDATIQSQPHPSLDAFLRWEAQRDLFWHPGGGGGGFGVDRLLLATANFYPGRILRELAPVSFRIDLGSSESDDGEPGDRLPGASSLFQDASEAARTQKARNNILETRIQIFPWLRLIERWEHESDRVVNAGLSSKLTNDQLENRLEIRPRGGLMILRGIGSNRNDKGAQSSKTRRFSGQWDQTWGHGWLSYLALDAERVETRERALGNLTYVWNPQGRMTWRRTLWRLDANLGGSLTWTRAKETSVGAAGGWSVLRRQAISATVSLQPHRVLSIRLQYGYGRSEVEVGTGDAKRWVADHDLRLRFLVRA